MVAKFAREIDAEGVNFVVPPSADSNVVDTACPKATRRYGFNFQLRSLHLYLLYVFLVVVSVKGITMLVERPVIINQTPKEQPTLDAEVTQSAILSKQRSLNLFLNLFLNRVIPIQSASVLIYKSVAGSKLW